MRSGLKYLSDPQGGYMRLIVGLVLFSLAVSAPGQAASDDATTQRAIIEYKRENYEEALQLLIQARTTEKRTTLSDYYTGLCQKQTGSYADAVESLTSAVQGQPPVKDAAVELVSALVNLERPGDAMKWVAWAEQEQVKPHEIAFLKGLVLVKGKRYNEALTAFNAARSGSAEADQQVDLQIAMVYAQQGKTEEARQSLKAIVTRYPGTDVAAFAAEYEQRISTALAAKRWSLFAGVNYLYDDNVTAVPKLRGATGDARNEKNSAVSENLRFEYDAPLGGRWAGNLQYSIQNTNYTRLREFNMLSHGVTLGAVHRNDTLLTSLPVNVTHTTLQYRNYSLQASFRPTGTIIFTPQHLGQISLGYTRREMYQNSAGPENNRNADIYNGQLAYIFLFADGQGMLNLRGEAFYENTAGFEWRHLGGRAGADTVLPVSGRTKLILTAEGTWQDYIDSSSLRKDTSVSASATVNQQLLDHFFLNLQYSYTRGMSNIDLFDYQRNLISSGIEVRF